MAGKERTASNLELVGGWLCLGFANTVSPRIEALVREYLTRYGDLVAWSQHAGILMDNEAEILLRNAVRRPDLAQAALGRVLSSYARRFTRFFQRLQITKSLTRQISEP
jgi:hypothetical protein